ncbi:RsmB/NOP family class I SAM-dependent RNA methyltransferase [Propionicicella superfundia]|uniref:RsmB/NOP family class I SAM-dependent RNA methyltransferase n=1 Tax=Propionicicella superfundia TaxID=348582 RepID=UPI0004249FDA|nr:transcription antitermination factor NusB [Propionicicella superfundia]
MAAVRRRADLPRVTAFAVLRAVTGDGAYPNIELSHALRSAGLTGRDAAFATELVNGTCRFQGTYDRILAVAGRRPLTTLQPAVVDLLRLGTHQLLAMRIPVHAAVAATVDLARERVGERVTGLVNAILRKVAAKELSDWMEVLVAGETDPLVVLATRLHHPEWIVRAYADVLPADEVEAALAANNEPAAPTLVCRPGITDRRDLLALGAEPCRWSPVGARYDGVPGELEDVRSARVGVQDEGSQLVALALSRAVEVAGPWLDLCAGPGGKAALLHGLARERGVPLVAAEVAPHRARLIDRAMAAYPGPHTVICADGTRPAWAPGSFAAVLADVPCTGLGALRRRPESRWRRDPASLGDLVPLQRALLRSALAAARPGGVVAYVTCSPHAAETTEVVDAVLADHPHTRLLSAPQYLPGVPGLRGDTAQLWPHRHGTDAMFLALVAVA